MIATYNFFTRRLVAVGVLASAVLVTSVYGINQNEEVYSLKELGKFPEPISQSAPAYPAKFLEQKESGWVLLEWVINSKGKVQDAEVVESSHVDFEQPAIDSILESKWRPGKKDGKKVSSKVRQRIQFNAPVEAPAE